MRGLPDFTGDKDRYGRAAQARGLALHCPSVQTSGGGLLFPSHLYTGARLCAARRHVELSPAAATASKGEHFRK